MIFEFLPPPVTPSERNRSPRAARKKLVGRETRGRSDG